MDTYKGKFTEITPSHEWKEIFTLEAVTIDVIIDFVFDNHSIFYLLVCKATGSRVNDFSAELVSFKYQQTLELVSDTKESGDIEHFDKNFLCPEEIALLANGQYHTLFETVRRGYSKADSKKYLHKLFNLYIDGLTGFVLYK